MKKGWNVIYETFSGTYVNVDWYPNKRGANEAVKNLKRMGIAVRLEEAK